MKNAKAGLTLIMTAFMALGAVPLLVLELAKAVRHARRRDVPAAAEVKQ